MPSNSRSINADMCKGACVALYELMSTLELHPNLDSQSPGLLAMQQPLQQHACSEIVIIHVRTPNNNPRQTIRP